MKIISSIILIIAISTLAIAKDIDIELFSSAAKGNIENVKLLLNRGANIDSTKNSQKITPLNIAAYNGHNNVVKLLIDKGANINSTNNMGFTPLIIASLKGHYEIVKTLLDANAKYDIRDKKGFTALTHAASTGDIKTCDLLIKYGAKVNTDGISPLLLAVLNQHESTVKFLLENGADPSKDVEIQNQKISVLLIAEQKGYVRIVDLLKSHIK